MKNHDIIICNKSWLVPDISNSEIFPTDYQQSVYKKDRNKQAEESSLLTESCLMKLSPTLNVKWYGVKHIQSIPSL